MKRTISVILLLSMLFCMMFSGPVSAENNKKVDLKDAIEIAKKSFEIDTADYDFNSNYSESNQGKKLWYLYWNSKKNGNTGISATIDADTGEIVNMYKWDYNAVTMGRIPKYSEDAALKAAESLAKKLAPEKFGQTVLHDLDSNSPYRPYYSSDVYSFYFVRKIDGIDFQDNGITVNVDKNSLDVRYYSMEWDNDIPSIKGLNTISSSEARKLFEEKLGMELSYHMIYTEPSSEPKLMLVYSFKNGNRPIDAFTGEIIKNSYRVPMYADKEGLGLGAGDDSVYAPTPEEQKAIDDAGKYITEQEAIAAIKEYVTIDGKYKLEHKSLNAYNKYDNADWSFSWSYSDKTINKYCSIYASVDAVTGEIKNFNIYDSENETKKPGVAKYNMEQSRKIAEEFLSEIQPEKFKTSEYRELYYDYIVKAEDVVNYNFNYIRMVNGIAFPSNTLSVTVNAYTGKVTNYSVNWKDMMFPEAKDVISLEDAYRLLYAKHDMELKYTRFYDYDNAANNMSVKLVYMLDNPFGMIDAKTGQFVDSNGKPVRDAKKQDFIDIKGHKHEADIQLLQQMNIINSVSDKFNPDDSILQKDFIVMLLRSAYPEYSGENDTDYERYYELAIRRNIITEKDKHPDASVTKLEASKMIVNALELGYIADLGSIFHLDVKDVSFIASENKGYAAIAVGLGLVDTAGGQFNPDAKLTRGETAAMLVKFLKIEKTPKA